MTRIIDNKNPIIGDVVVYLIQCSARKYHNYTFEYAKKLSKDNNLKLQLLYVNDPKHNYSERQLIFILEGLLDLEKSLKAKINIIDGNTFDCLVDKKIIVTDQMYVKPFFEINKQLFEDENKHICLVDGNVIVPINIASLKQEYAAYTIRNKIYLLVSEYMNDFKKLVADNEVNYYIDPKQYNISNYFKTYDIKTIMPFHGGYQHAIIQLKKFMKQDFLKYHQQRNSPSDDVASKLSAYLNYGHMSPHIVLKNLLACDGIENYDSYFEELVIRRELAFNYCYYNQGYDNLKTMDLANWVYQDMEVHQFDKRPYLYHRKILEQAKTHDKYWNSAQRKLFLEGRIHGYMRMYWGKKIIEWSSSYENALEMMIFLNDTYALDGKSANGYSSIAWCFAKHDRAFFEREIFGKIRYMNDKGIEKKFKMEKYLKKYEN